MTFVHCFLHSYMYICVVIILRWCWIRQSLVGGRSLPGFQPFWNNIGHLLLECSYLSVFPVNTVPKVIDFPIYNTKCSGENEILRGIFGVVFRFHYISCYISEIWITFWTVNRVGCRLHHPLSPSPSSFLPSPSHPPPLPSPHTAKISCLLMLRLLCLHFSPIYVTLSLLLFRHIQLCVSLSIFLLNICLAGCHTLYLSVYTQVLIFSFCIPVLCLCFY